MKNLFLFTLLLFLFLNGAQAFAQFGEPEVQKKEIPRNLFDEGYKAGFGINLILNDFGFGAGGQFRYGLRPYLEGLATFKIMGLKDPSEQTFTDFFGYRTIPEKYQRVITVPIMVGLKKRFFPAAISDDFRLYSSLSAGPAYAVSIPYFDDSSANGSENGFRENSLNVYGFVEPVNDIFKGWKQSKSHWGVGGEFVIGVDFGDKFKNLSSIQFGYSISYFSDGIQVLEPCRPDLSRIDEPPVNACGFANSVQVYRNDGSIGSAPLEKANDPRKYFGSAQISFVFGWMW